MLFYKNRFLLIVVTVILSLTGCSRQQAQKKEHGKKTIEVSMFQGGFGIDFHLSVAREYERLHPDVKINLWGDPRNTEKLRPRFVSGNPPDLVLSDLPVWSLAAAGLVYPLDKALDSPAYEQPDLKWGDTLIPGLTQAFKMDDHTYAIIAELTTLGYWYNIKMFRENGWQVPKTWDQFLDICEKARAKGIDPIAFQGRYPQYITQTFEDLVQRIGGPQAWADIQNMKPGAWKSPAVRNAATLVYNLRDKQFIKDDYMGMSHMEAQIKFVQGKAAMIPCGTWLKTEMKSNTPDGFKMGFFPTPTVKGGRGESTAINVGGAVWFVTSASKHPEVAADFLKFMTSLSNAKRFVREKESLLAVKGSDVGLPPELESAASCLRKANFTYMSQIPFWYPTFARTWYNEAISNLMNRKYTPEQFCEQLEGAAANLRRDNRIKKYSMSAPEGRVSQ